VRNNATKDLHDVHPVIDEMSHFQLSTNQGLVFRLQAETHMIWQQAGWR
jgi:hypothetical protein